MTWIASLLPHRRLPGFLDPRTKILVLLTLSAIVVCLDRPISLLLAMAGALIVAMASRPPRTYWLYLLPIALLGVWGMVFSQAIFYGAYPRTALWVICSPNDSWLGQVTGGIAVYREGMIYGFVQSLRFAVMLTLGLLVGFTTEPRDLLAGLLACRVPSALAFMVTTSLRFVPTVMAEAQQVLQTQRLRGARLLTWPPWETLRSILGFLKPLLVRNIRRAGLAADAVETRGFHAQMDRRKWRESSLRPLTLRSWDIALMVLCVCVAVTVVAAKIAHFAYVQGFYAPGWVRALGGFASNYL